MGEIKVVSISSLKKGSNIVLDGVACTIVDMKTSRPGKHGHAKVNLMAVGMLDNKKRNAVMPGHDKVEVPMIDKRNAQILAVDGQKANVMDMETYETFDLDINDEVEGEVKSGQIIVYWVILDDKILKQIKQEAE